MYFLHRVRYFYFILGDNKKIKQPEEGIEKEKISEFKLDNPAEQ